MGVRIDAHEAPKPKRRLVPTPVQIEPPRIRVDFDRNAVIGAGGQNLLDIDLITRAPQELPAGRVTEDSRVGIAYGTDDALCLRRAVEFEAPMDARHDKIERLQHLAGKIQRSVRKDIGLDAFKNTECASVS